VTPVGVKATHIDDHLAMRAILFSADGVRDLADEISAHVRAGDARAAARVGEDLGAKMIARGARDLLNE
jgi:porphobilinogen deaminase